MRYSDLVRIVLWSQKVADRRNGVLIGSFSSPPSFQRLLHPPRVSRLGLEELFGGVHIVLERLDLTCFQYTWAFGSGESSYYSGTIPAEHHGIVITHTVEVAT